MKNHTVTRRNFLKTSLTVSAACGLSPWSWSQTNGANNDIRMAVVGLNGRGTAHILAFSKYTKGTRVVAFCDVDQTVLDKRAADFGKVEKYRDIRKLLENKDIDAITIATPNHWHSLATIWACQAGKDVYVEKPCSHNVFEGRKCVEAARKYNRIVQHGIQKRGSPPLRAMIDIVKSGKYGKLQVAKGYCCKPRWSIGFKGVEQPPATLDFDTWLGPAAKQDFHRNLVHYNWHWFWDFGGGDLANQGVHELDVARWAAGGTLPRSVVSLGGRYVDTPDFKDQGQTPNQLISLFDFGGTLVLFETRGLIGPNPNFPAIDKNYPMKLVNEYYFEDGVIKGNKFYPKGNTEGELVMDKDPNEELGGEICYNFVDCMRSRKREQLVSDISEGHYSSTLCHLSNISYRLAKERPFEKPKDFSDNSVVGDSVMTLLENTKALGVDPQKATLWAGPKLRFDAEKEKFVNAPEADKLLTRNYRAPFIVPEKV